MNHVRLAFFNCFGFISIGCIVSQLIPLLNKDFSSMQKSFILGLGALTSFLLAVLLGKMSDSIKKIKPSVFVSMFVYLLFISFIFIDISRLLKGISFIIVIAMSRMLMSTIETFILSKKKETFAKYHCMGAIGLIIGSLSSSFLDDIQKVMFCFFSGFVCILLVLPIKEEKKETKSIQLKDMIVLLKNKTYLRILSLIFFLMMMGFADQFVVIDKMLSLGASSTLITIKYAIQASMEIPLYLLVNRILKRFNYLSLLLICIFMSAIKLGLYALVKTPYMIVLVSLLQIVTHPLIVILSKKMISVVTPSHLLASSQIIGFAFYFGMSGFLAAFISQWLNQQYSFNITLYTFSLLSILPFIIWCFMRKYDKVKVVIENENILN